MQNLKRVNLIFSAVLVVSLFLLASAIVNGEFTQWAEAFFIGMLTTSIPIIISGFLCIYFLKRTMGIASYIVLFSFLVIVLVGLGMYIYFYWQPADKVAGFEFILIPIYQLMAIPFATLIGVLLKNKRVNS